MKLAQKIINIVENKKSMVDFFELSKSVYAMSLLVDVIGNKKMSKEMQGLADEIEAFSKKSVDEKQFKQALDSFELQDLFKQLQTVFKEYEDSGKKLKQGRKEVSLKDALLNFTQKAQKVKEFSKL
jgi:hypothetical protein